jgi:hypothetical protein
LQRGGDQAEHGARRSAERTSAILGYSSTRR